MARSRFTLLIALFVIVGCTGTSGESSSTGERREAGTSVPSTSRLDDVALTGNEPEQRGVADQTEVGTGSTTAAEVDLDANHIFLDGSYMGRWANGEWHLSEDMRDAGDESYLGLLLHPTDGSAPYETIEGSSDVGPCASRFELGHDGVAITNLTWNATPRLAVAIEPQDAHVEAVRQILIGDGLVEPEIDIASVLRVDLDGDGTDEVLIDGPPYVAGTTGRYGFTTLGDYSIVLLRDLEGDRVTNTPLAVISTSQADLDESDLIVNGEPVVASYRAGVIEVQDLNGDGALEVIIEFVGDHYYEYQAYDIMHSLDEPVLRHACFW